MSGKFRRYFVPNSLVFITQVVNKREPIFREKESVALLLKVLHTVKEFHPFNMLGYVFLPEHFHILIKPTGASHFDKIMGSFKTNFTKEYKAKSNVAGSMRFWQPRFRDHIIRNDLDLHRHMDYIHYNPVKHKLVKRPEEWTQSSFELWKEKGFYSDMWGWSLPDTLKNWEPPDSEK